MAAPSSTTSRPAEVPDFAAPREPRPLPPTGLRAARRGWPFVVLAVVVFTAAGAAWGLRRAPEYTADARISAIRLDVQNIAGLPGALDASKALTTLYSRAVIADEVTRPVARAAHVSPAYVLDHVDATPVPDAPIIKVTARSPRSGEAIRLANATSDALLAFATAHTEAAAGITPIMDSYRRHQLRAAVLRDVLGRATRRVDAAPTAEHRRAFREAAADLEQENLRIEYLRQAYQNAQLARAAAPNAQEFAAATTVTSDRSAMVQLAVFLGVLAGLAVGVAVAALFAARRRGRQPAG